MPTEMCNIVSQELQNDRRLIETIQKYNGRQNNGSVSQKNELSKVPLLIESIDKVHSTVMIFIDMQNISIDLLQAANNDVHSFFRVSCFNFSRFLI